MNYFGRIIHKTIGPVQHSVRPAVTPESIPETPHALAAKQDMPAGKNTIAPANGNLIPHATPHATSAPIENSMAPSSHVTPAAAAPEAVATVEGGILPKEPQALLSPANLVSSDRPLEKSTSVRPAPIEAPSKEPESFSVKNSDDADAKPRLAVVEQRVVKQASLGEESAAAHMEEDNETSPELSLLDEPQILGGKEKTNDKLADVESWPQGDSIAHKQAMPVTSPKADLLHENMQDASYSILAPTAPSKTTRYSALTSQPEETVVMINIGRIEVKAEVPAKPTLRPKFSPALSLADYLKQRSEGKIG
jgi:hypothetical protein